MNTIQRGGRLLALAAGCAAAAFASGKEAHFEEVKFRLLAEHIRCDHCHVSREETGLTAYGRRIADLGRDKSVHERVRVLEEEILRTAAEPQRKAEQARVDIDGDGVPNWIEILAGRSPSAKDEPSPEAVALQQRVTDVVQCTLCHVQVDAVAGPGKSRAPHNGFGKTLTEFSAKGVRLRGAAVQKADAEDVEIGRRLDSVDEEDADRDGQKNWDEIRTFHLPADLADKVTTEELKRARQLQTERRKADEGFGKAHRPKPPKL